MRGGVQTKLQLRGIIRNENVSLQSPKILVFKLVLSV